jgi:hypothetical protein
MRPEAPLCFGLKSRHHSRLLPWLYGTANATHDVAKSSGDGAAAINVVVPETKARWLPLRNLYIDRDGLGSRRMVLRLRNPNACCIDVPLFREQSC